MSYEGRLKNFQAALSRHGVTAALALITALGALYVMRARPGGPADFPRDEGDFLQAQKAERRLAELSGRLESAPSDLAALSEAGRLKFQLGPARYAEAIADLERARDLGLADTRSFYYLGRMYQAEGLYEFALKEYERFLNNYPADEEVRMLAAKLRYAAGDYPLAARDFEALLAARPGDPVLLENLAIARWKNGQDPAGALASLRALGGAGAFLADQVEGSMAHEKKDYPSAAALLRKAAAAAPAGYEGLGELLWEAADASLKNREYAPARDELRRLLELDPSHEAAKAALAKAEKALRAEEKKAKSGRK